MIQEISFNESLDFEETVPDLAEREVPDVAHDVLEFGGTFAHIILRLFRKEVLLPPFPEETVVVGEDLLDMPDPNRVVVQAQSQEVYVVPYLGQVPDVEAVDEGKSTSVQGCPDGIGQR